MEELYYGQKKKLQQHTHTETGQMWPFEAGVQHHAETDIIRALENAGYSIYPT